MRKLVLFLFVLNLGGLFAQLDTIHYIPPLHSRRDASVRHHYIYLSTPETVPFQVEVTDGSGTPFPGSPFTLSNAIPLEIYIENGQLNGSKLMVPKTELNTVLTDKGLYLHGEKTFYANARYRQSNTQAGSLTSKGLKSLGNSFRVGYTPFQNENNTPIRNFVIGIMATEDNTQINVSDYDVGVVFSGSTDVTDDQLDFTLDAGNTMVLSGYMDVTANFTGMLGALIESDKPIAVNNGSWCGTITSSANSQDICIDQIVPVDNLGYTHVSVMAEGTGDQERPMVVAHYDNTQVFLNGSTTPASTLSAGDYFLIDNSYYAGTTHFNMLIETSQPAYVYQFLAGTTDEQTPGMNFLPPLTCNLPTSVDLIPSIEKIGTTTYSGGLFIISKIGGAVEVNSVLQTDPMPVAGSSDWETYKIYGVTGDTKVESDKSIAVGFFGVNSAAGYGGYYSGFSSTFKAEFTMEDSLCLGETFDIEFTGDSIADLNVNWDFGTTDVSSTIQNNYTPTQINYLNAGTYDVELTLDYDNCESTYSRSIVINPLPTATISGTVTVCEGAVNPDITFTGANGTAPYTFTYNINGGANTTVVSTGNTATISASTTTDGIFTYNLVSVEDASSTNCTRVQTGSAIVTVSPLPTATISGTVTVCQGATSPEVTFTGANGTAPYTFTYNINGGANTTVISTGNTATVDASTTTDGTFSYNLVSVSDASTNACSQTQTGSAVITINPSPTASVSGDTEICVDDISPEITFTGADGTAPYTFTYNINGGANTTVVSTGNTATLSVNTSTDGTFSYNLVSVSDASANACSQTQTGSATVVIHPLPTATIAAGATDVTFTGANGTAPYTFTYNINGAANTTVVSIGNTATVNVNTSSTGDYTYNLISVSDASTTNCSQPQSGSVTVSINSSPTATISGTSEVCNGDANPTITFTGADGVAPYTFTYNINGGSNNTVISTGNTATLSVNTDTDGTFTYNLVSVEDAGFVSQAQTGSASVTVNPLPTASISGTTSVCIDDTNPEITFTGANGNAPYTFTYNINGGVSSTIVSTGNTAVISVNTSSYGTFTYNLVSVEDASSTNCSQTQTGSAVITVNISPTATISGSTTICQDATNPEVTFTGANGTAPYTFTYNINGGANTTAVSTGNIATVSANSATEGTFTYNLVSVADASLNACSQAQTGSATISINPLPITLQLSADTTLGCQEACVNFEASSTINSGSIDRIESYIEGDNNLYSANIFQHCFQNSGLYNVVVEAFSDLGCSTIDTFQNFIEIYPYPIANFTATDFCFNDLIDLTANTNPSENNNASYTWTYDNNSTNGTSLQEVSDQIGDFPVKLLVTSEYNCLDSITQNITVNPLPITVQLSADTILGCQEACINFQASSSINIGAIDHIESYIEGDNNLYSTNTFQHCFQNSGMFNVVVEAISDQGCSAIDTFVNFVEIYPFPVSDFNLENFCLNDTINLVADTTSLFNTNASYTWTYDNNSTNGTSLQEVYDQIGDFPVKLLVTSEYNCLDSISQTISIYPLPSTQLLADNLEACQEACVNFDVSTTITSGTIDQIESYIDGNSSLYNTPIFEHCFQDSGRFTVIVEAISDQGCSVIDTFLNFIQINPFPEANYTIDHFCLNDTITLSADTNYTVNTNATYAWKYNNNLSIGPEINEIPSQIGSQSLRLIVTSSDGCLDSITQNITIDPLPNIQLLSDISVGCPGSCINFDASASINSGSVNQIESSIEGDNNLYTNTSFEHCFQNTGTYNLIVKAQSDQGCTEIDTLDSFVEIYSLPLAEFNTNDFCLNTPIQLSAETNVSQNINASYAWNYNEEIISGNSLSTMPFQIGLETIKLIVTSNNGCLDSISKSITIHPLPMVQLFADDTTACPETCINFETSSTINYGSVVQLDSYLLGDNNLYSNNTFEHCFQDSGRYTLMVEAVSDQGCITIDTFQNFIQIYPAPIAIATVDEEVKRIRTAKFKFENLSLEIDSLNWIFEEEIVGTTEDYYFTLQDTGIFIMNLEVFNSYGCVDTTDISVRVTPEFYAYFPNSFTPNDDGMNDNWFPVIGYGLKSYQLFIFNRWGELIFETDNYEEHWDGFQNNSDKKAQDGVYTYKSVIIDDLDKEHVFIGHISLVE